MKVTITVDLCRETTYEDLSLILGRVVARFEDDEDVLSSGDRVHINTQGLPANGVDVDVGE